MTLWQAILMIAIIVYVWYFTATSLRIHHGLGTSAYDFGNYEQGIWLFSRFKAPFITLLGRNLWGDHTTFILVFIAPIYRVFSVAGTLLFIQSVALAAGAIPIFLYARQRLGAESWAVGLAVAYLMHPVVGWTNLDDFHVDAFLGVLVGFAIYFALNERWRLYAVFVVLSLLVKEDVSFVIVPLGIWVALRKNRRVGLATIAFSLAYMWFAIVVVIGSLSGGHPQAWRIPFGGPIGLLATLFKRPGELFDYLTSGGRLWYLWQVTAPFAGVFLLLPEIAAIGLLVLTVNVVSLFAVQQSIFFHYTIVALPALAMGTVHALGKLQGLRRAVVAGLVIVMLVWTGFLWGTLPFSRNPHVHWNPDHPIAVAGREIVSEVPDDSIVAAFHLLSAHLSRRDEVYFFPNPFATEAHGYDPFAAARRLPQADDVEYVLLPSVLEEGQSVVWEREKASFEIWRSNEHWDLFRRIDE